jgi:UDP-N-acetylglucosamine--N-acetylmuramyl-(pentapeptide) pyrophosphoryl-undecaprenol N-acetylglucosamine transferase
MNVAIACGGTGGHLFPGIAVAQALRREGHTVLLLVSKKDVDQHVFEIGEGFEVQRIPAIGLPVRKLSLAMIGFLCKLIVSICKCQWMYFQRGIDVVLGMGGFTSAAAVLAAQWKFIPTVIHESNSIPGKANLWVARRARFAACGMQDCVENFRPGKGVWTGTPVRTSLSEMPKDEARHKLSLDPAKPTVLVMGGSQGAEAINQAAMGAWPRIKEFNLIHLTGETDLQLAKDVYEGAGAPVCVRAFLCEMELAYNAADIVVSRAGAASLAEIAHYRLPNILIPYPFAAENHQQRNAEVFEKAAAGQILTQEELSGDKLALVIRSLFNNETKRTRMVQKLAALDKTNAAAEIVDLLKQAGHFETVAHPKEATA